jgi:ribose transport system substrate-binding protein
MIGPQTAKDAYLVGAFIQACQVMESFRGPNEVLRLRDIVARTKLPKGTVFRLLYTLHSKGFVEKTGENQFRIRITLPRVNKLRLGYAIHCRETGFTQIVSESLIRAAETEGLELIILDNRDAETTLRNADVLIRERVDVAIEFQDDPAIAETLSAKYLAASIPLIAIDLPHPAAAYFGPNNYQVGVIGGREMGRWAMLHWERADVDVLLVGQPTAGAVPQSRIKGMLAGLGQAWRGRHEYRVHHVDTAGDFESSYEAVRKHLRRTVPRETLVGAVNDSAALAAIRAFRDVGLAELCAVVGGNAEPEARAEMRLPGTRLIGSVACFPEKYGRGVLSLAKKVAGGAQPPPVVFTRHALITPANVDRVYPADRVGNAASDRIGDGIGLSLPTRQYEAADR